MSNLQHSFTVSSRSITVDTDTVLNVVKRRAKIKYRTILADSAANIAYISADELSVNNNLSIADRSSSIISNRLIEANYTTITGTKTFDINTSDFLITDVFVTESNTSASIPLFYKHVIDHDNLPRDTLDEVVSGYSVEEVKFFDQTLQQFNPTEKYIDSDNGTIYHNTTSLFTDSNNYEYYYVQYKIKDDTGNIFSYTDLLNPQSVYREAIFEDLDVYLQIKQDGRKVYLISEEPNNFNITLPNNSTQYAYKPLGTNQLTLLKPGNESRDDPWFVRVTNNKFFTNIGGTLYKYSVAEFLNQSFDPEPTIKKISSETSTRLAENIIKLDRNRIYQDEDLDLYVDILVNNADDEGVIAYTTNSLLVGTAASNSAIYKKWNNTSREGISSIDHWSGFVEVEGVDIQATDKIISTYYFIETNYEYTPINFNPIENNDILYKRASIFVDPDTILTNKTQTLYYLLSDNIGHVIESNHPSFDNNTQLWDGNNLWYETIPSYVASGVNEDFFVDNYTVEGDNNTNYLILGDITINNSDSPNTIEYFDSRLRGGGIREDAFDELTLTREEIESFWDHGFWDGKSYPGNASYYVEVPVNILADAGGSFTQQEVTDVVHRHTAFGSYPIVKGYGVDILVSGIATTTSGITLSWSGYGL